MARRNKTTAPDEVLLNLEARLAGTLKPIQPSSEILHRLRERIHLPAREEIVLRLRDWKKMFLVFSGVMSSMLVIITIARALYFFVGKKHL